MTEGEGRAAVLLEVRSWLGTPWRHEGDVKRIGVDCLMLLVRVYVDTGLIEPFDPRPYPQRWHLHQNEERYLAGILRYGHELAEPGPGDIIIWRVGRTFSHAGIIGRWDTRKTVIHAYARAGHVEESDLSLVSELSDPKRPRRYFSIWGGAA